MNYHSLPKPGLQVMPMRVFTAATFVLKFYIARTRPMGIRTVCTASVYLTPSLINV